MSFVVVVCTYLFEGFIESKTGDVTRMECLERALVSRHACRRQHVRRARVLLHSSACNSGYLPDDMIGPITDDPKETEQNRCNEVHLVGHV